MERIGLLNIIKNILKEMIIVIKRKRQIKKEEMVVDQIFFILKESQIGIII
ncbi:MAG: hypothetical protein K8R49_06245 [Candidatus Cloacimonetes bacterium]|nr:hypothetical protein [Candidatus Cloacimonadota bacterium]